MSDGWNEIAKSGPPANGATVDVWARQYDNFTRRWISQRIAGVRYGTYAVKIAAGGTTFVGRSDKFDIKDDWEPTHWRAEPAPPAGVES